MSQQNQRTDATEVDSQHNARHSPEESPGNPTDPPGGYPQTISELSDSASVVCSQYMLAALRIHARTFWVLIWKTLLAFYFSQMYPSSLISLRIWHMICLIINYKRDRIMGLKFLCIPAKEL